MLLKRRAVFVLGLLLAAFSADALRALAPGKAISQYVREAWTAERGMPQNSVHALLQTRDGYLWVATQEGIARFDGLHFEIYDQRRWPEIQSRLFSDLAEGRDGSLWASSASGLLHISPQGLQGYTLEHGLGDERVHTVAVDAEGTVWIGSAAGLQLLRGDRFAPFRAFADWPEDLEVTTIAPAPESGLWIGTMRSGALYFRAGSFVHISRAQGLSNNHVHDFLFDAAGQVWIATDQGINRLELPPGGPRRADEVRIETYGIAEGLASSRVYALEADRHGQIWIGTHGAGLHRLEADGSISRWQGENVPQLIRDLLEDRDGNLWVGSAGGAGLIRLSDGAVTPIDVEAGLRHDKVYTAMEDRRGAVWIGTFGGGLYRLHEGRLDRLTAADGLTHDKVWSLAEGPEGEIWVGTYGGGLYRLRADGGEIDRFTTAHGLSSNYVRAILPDRQGALWIGTRGGLDRLRDGRITSFHIDDGLPANSIYSLLETGSGELWIGTVNGLSVFDGTTFRNYFREDGLSDTRIYGLYESTDGDLWIGTANGGLNRLRNGEFTVFRARDGLYDDLAYSLLEDHQGFLWASCNRGIYRVRLADLEAFAEGRIERFTSQPLGLADGLRHHEPNGGSQPASWLRSNGELLFPTLGGLAVVDPRALDPSPEPPAALVEQVRSGDQRLTFRFTAPSFRSPDNLRFRYRLEGYDRDWVDSGNERTAAYTRVPPGRYRFRVASGFADGSWSDAAASVSVVVPTPTWRSWWALCLYAISLLAVITALVRWQQRRVRREREINERLRAVDRMKDEFLANTSHELRTPLFGIVGLAESLSEGIAGEVPDSVRTNLQAIVGSGRRLGALVNNILDYSNLRGRGIELRSRPVALHDRVEEAIALCRPVAGGKDLELRNGVARDLPPVDADPARLLQILLNLVDNGVKFTATGTVEVGAREVDGTLEVWVRDTGPGIPEGQRQRIFDAFEQLDSSTERRHGGSGLGLAISRRLVELHDGRMWIESTPGEGSTFYFTLPMAEGSPAPMVEQPDSEHDFELSHAPPSVAARSAATANARELAEAGREAIRILVVDDEPINRMILGQQLQIAGFSVVEAVDGPEAISRLQSEPFDLVLLDVMMPKMSGYEVCRQIRNQRGPRQLPVLFVTAKNGIDDRVAGFDAGGNDYLAKPVALAELLARVRFQLSMVGR